MAGGNGDDVGSKGDAMYWLMPVGLVLGLVVVVLFESIGRRGTNCKALFRQLVRKAKDEPLHPTIEEKLASFVDSPKNIFEFWSGGSLTNVSKDHLTKVYEMLALVCALMLSVCVAFYTASNKSDYIYGIVCCIANCTLWMGTLSSAFFCVVIHTCKSEKEVELLKGIYGNFLMRVPMLMLVWGLISLFLVFILYFKLNIDPYFHCSLCLGGCFILAPLFFHCMHKMGWARAIVYAHYTVERSLSTPPTTSDLQALLEQYAHMKRNNVLAMDREEYISYLDQPHLLMTSVSKEYSLKLFQEYVSNEIDKLHKNQFRNKVEIVSVQK